MRDADLASLSDLDELLAVVTERETLQEAPGKSGARIERVVIDGQRYVLKHWTRAATGPSAPRAACGARRCCSGSGGSSPGCRTA